LVTLAVQVRIAAAADIHRTVEVYRASRRDAFQELIPAAAVLPRTRQDDIKRWRQFAEAGDGHLFVAEIGSEIIGMAALEYQTSVAELGALYVHPHHCRAGAGSALLASTLAAARADSRDQVVAWVLASNQRAKEFFLARGGWLDGGVEARRLPDSVTLIMQRIRFDAIFSAIST
jgi:N-acetylglutamate synthase-like GNAT family acetyltransferase